ncbi:MAG: electron transfer flavoprotein subunit beta, partial [Verrucomicrobia bacterium]|nr:electron transfer flavoprotein subunit beta [Verrucomicrobiota bacterium]
MYRAEEKRGVQAFVIWKSVPDTVEELTVRGDGGSLEREALRYTLGDADEHALEQALLLKERHGGKVQVITLDAPEVDQALYAALAKGADSATKIAIDQTALGTAAIAQVVASFLTAAPGRIASDTLLLPGSQAIDDLEGELGAFLAEAVGLPYLGVVCGVTLADGRATATKEFAGGVRGEFEVPLPAVLGIQSAEKPPRYVPVA